MGVAFEAHVENDVRREYNLAREGNRARIGRRTATDYATVEEMVLVESLSKGATTFEDAVLAHNRRPGPADVLRDPYNRAVGDEVDWRCVVVRDDDHAFLDPDVAPARTIGTGERQCAGTAFVHPETPAKNAVERAVRRPVEDEPRIPLAATLRDERAPVAYAVLSGEDGLLAAVVRHEKIRIDDRGTCGLVPHDGRGNLDALYIVFCDEEKMVARENQPAVAAGGNDL